MGRGQNCSSQERFLAVMGSRRTDVSSASLAFGTDSEAARQAAGQLIGKIEAANIDDRCLADACDLLLLAAQRHRSSVPLQLVAKAALSRIVLLVYNEPPLQKGTKELMDF